MADDKNMEKYGVQTDETKTKTATVLSGTCPKCGAELDEEGGEYIAHCQLCGTEPFELKPNFSLPEEDD